MTIATIAHPPIVSQDEWLEARTALLVQEKELTRQRDAINAARRRLPMVRVEKDYRFSGPNGEVKLFDLFEGRRQLVIYHFMFHPDAEDGCPGCTWFTDSLSDLQSLDKRDAGFALVSRAPYEKLAAYKQRHGWSVPWYSSYGSDFNCDYNVTFDETVAPTMYNYRPVNVPREEQPSEGHGLSVFFRLDNDVFHTYSTYARGVEGLNLGTLMLDVTPYGRQEAFEDSPPGWPQRPTYG
jgi:predicted dithiol-disulfide oxidoreductase (DUF899 family)